MRRARDTSHVYVVADYLDQAVDDLTVEWSADRRQRWMLDVDEPASADRERRPPRLRSLDLQLRLEQFAQRPAPARETGRARGP